jgi:hypothetical protein
MRAPFDDLLFVSQAPFRSNEHSIRLIQVGTTHIASLNSLEVIPDALIQIEVGRIVRQPPQMQALGCSCDFTLLLALFVKQFLAEPHALRPIESNQLCRV